MSTNTHESNASPAHGLDQANHVSHVHIRTCCACTSMTYQSELDHCSSCYHPFCEMCSDNFSEHDPLALHLAAQALHTPRHMSIPVPRPPPRLLPVTSESNQPQNSTGREERYPPAKAQNEVNIEQEHEPRPQGENPEEQHSSPTPQRKKRKLNTEKCQRCRDDKKGCTWKSPEKCDRCMDKGLPCSERTRVTRPRKLALRHTSPAQNDVSPTTDLDLFQERFQKWIFLKSYHKMMTMARERVERLQKHMRRTFGWICEPPFARRLDLFRFGSFVLEVRYALDQALGETITTENGSESFPARSLTEGQSLALFLGSSDALCLECYPKYHSPMVDKAEKSMDDCGRFLVQQHFFQKHSKLLDLHEGEVNDDSHQGKAPYFESRELERYTILSREIPQQAGAILKSLHFPDTGRSIGIYHFDIEAPNDVGWHLNSIDCLRRTPLHRHLDYLFEERIGVTLFPRRLFDNDLVDISFWSSQDILGRTPLHILCQFPYLDKRCNEVERLLGLGVNPGLRTVYGSLPLHYVAANGHFKICELLMEHKTRFNIGAEDNNGRTALGYAIINRHGKVTDLLMDHYKEVGLGEELERAQRIYSAVSEGILF